MALIDFTLSNARRFYSSMGNPSGLKGLSFNLGKNAMHCFVFQSFLQILLINYLPKMHGYPQCSFLISITLFKIYISHIIINQGKNTFELVGTFLKSTSMTIPGVVG